MMTPIKSYVADSMVGKKFHFKCNCIFNIDLIGTIKGWDIHENEIIWNVYTDKGKMIKIGENHPNMNIEEVK